MGLINAHQIAEIICLGGQAEIDAINAELATMCGMVLTIIPPDQPSEQ